MGKKYNDGPMPVDVKT